MTAERTCEECGDTIDGDPRWTLRNVETADDNPIQVDDTVHFCSDECESGWSFDRALERLKEEREKSEAADE